ncbi:MAG: hypothetical protein ACJ71Z_02980 [Aeromicrobium sp.]
MHSPVHNVQTYRVSDADAQGLIAGLLATVDDLTVGTATRGSGHFLTVECADEARAQSIYELIMTIDEGAIPVPIPVDVPWAADPAEEVETA